MKPSVSQDCRIFAKIPTPARRFLNKTLTMQRIFCSLSQGNPEAHSHAKRADGGMLPIRMTTWSELKGPLSSSLWFFNNSYPWVLDHEAL